MCLQAVRQGMHAAGRCHLKSSCCCIRKACQLTAPADWHVQGNEGKTGEGAWMSGEWLWQACSAYALEARLGSLRRSP